MWANLIEVLFVGDSFRLALVWRASSNLCSFCPDMDSVVLDFDVQ